MKLSTAIRELYRMLRLSPSFVSAVYQQHTKDENTYQTLDQAIDGECNLVGVSYGGILAMRYALKNPDKVKNLVTVVSAFRGTRGVYAGHTMYPLGVRTPVLDDLHPDSNFTVETAKMMASGMPKLTADTQLYNIVSEHDQFVPLSSMTLDGFAPPGSYQEVVVEEGHCQAFFSPTCTSIVKPIVNSRRKTHFIHPIIERGTFFNAFLITLSHTQKLRTRVIEYDFMKRYGE
ncbi:alpha/beta fold hydrolase [Nanoarchaeota archaeon]